MLKFISYGVFLALLFIITPLVLLHLDEPGDLSPPSTVNYRIVTGTFYNPVIKQTDSSFLVTADCSIIDTLELQKGSYRWVALSRNLLKRWGGPYDYGDTIIIRHPNKILNGEWIVHDSMNARFVDRIDFLVCKYDTMFPDYTPNLIIHNKSKYATNILSMY